MSVQTTADEKIDIAGDAAHEASVALSEVCINECWGAEDLSSERRAELQQCLNDLLSIKHRLRK